MYSGWGLLEMRVIAKSNRLQHINASWLLVLLCVICLKSVTVLVKGLVKSLRIPQFSQFWTRCGNLRGVIL